MASDKALRGKYLFLLCLRAQEMLRERPSRQELESEILLLEATVSDQRGIPGDELFAQTGVLLGRLASMAYKIIHNFELRDYADRKIAEDPRAAE